MKHIKNIVCIMCLIGGFVFADEIIKEHPPITVYIVRNGDSERTIHKIFITEKSARKYVDQYKDSHSYEFEPLLLKE